MGLLVKEVTLLRAADHILIMAELEKEKKMYREKLLKIANTLEEEEAELLLTSLKSSNVEGIGFVEHKDACSLFRPHSHSVDCDCGADETTEKILSIIDGS